MAHDQLMDRHIQRGIDSDKFILAELINAVFGFQGSRFLTKVIQRFVKQLVLFAHAFNKICTEPETTYSLSFNHVAVFRLQSPQGTYLADFSDHVPGFIQHEDGPVTVSGRIKFSLGRFKGFHRLE